MNIEILLDYILEIADFTKLISVEKAINRIRKINPEN